MARTKAAPVALQESILTLLAFDERWGAHVAALIEARHFDEEYRPAAEALLKYWRDYSKPPGRAHLDDVFDLSEIAADQRDWVRDLVASLITQLEQGFNPKYVAGRVTEFVRHQVLKVAILDASDRYSQGGDAVAQDVERILFGALRFHEQKLEPGLFLSDTRGLEYIEHGEFYKLNLPELDKRGIGPAPGELILYIAPKGSGKSWFCVHVGKTCQMQGARVLHISLEMSEVLCFKRYVQAYFAVARNSDEYRRTVLEFEFEKLEERRLAGWHTERQFPGIAFTDEDANRVLARKIKRRGRLGNVLIKRFPTNQLKVPQLVAYLDYLESVHKFVPNVVIIDYPDLMSLDVSNYRHSLGTLYPELRGIAVERNFGLICPTQGNRGTLGTRHVQSRDVSEDIRKINIADHVLTYSQTKSEKPLGLARLRVEHARDAEDAFELVMTQSYTTGQFVLETARMEKIYWKKMTAEEE
jgi:hypothetical protein